MGLPFALSGRGWRRGCVAVRSQAKKAHRRSWAGLDLVGRSVRGLDLAVAAFKATSGPSAAARAEAKKIATQLRTQSGLLPDKASVTSVDGAEDGDNGDPPDWAKALRPDEYGDEGMKELRAIRGTKDRMAHARPPPGHRPGGAALHGGMMAARFGQRLHQRAKVNIARRQPGRGQHRGWQLIRSVLWIPSESGRPKVRVDVLKAVLKSRGRKRRKIVNKERRKNNSGHSWKLGSVTVRCCIPPRPPPPLAPLVTTSLQSR